MVRAICAEITMQRGYLPASALKTIYFGGGTPSLLSESELNQIFETIQKYHTIAPDAEITLEANPDDLTVGNLNILKKYVNRLSIGIQTFDADTLKNMNRAHNAHEAQTCVKAAQDAGFENISVDLMYCLGADFENDLVKTIALEVPHVSVYCLSIAPKTVWGTQLLRGHRPEVNEEQAASEFEKSADALIESGYEHYEISSFAKPGRYSRHNSAYWQRKPYLGVGPSAHSYNGHSRQYNVANNAQYIRVVEAGNLDFEIEQLTPSNQVNEYIMTSIRTMWGCDMAIVKELAGDRWGQCQKTTLNTYTTNGLLAWTHQGFKLTKAGKLFADRIAADLFLD